MPKSPNLMNIVILATYLNLYASHTDIQIYIVVSMALDNEIGDNLWFLPEANKWIVTKSTKLSLSGETRFMHKF